MPSGRNQNATEPEASSASRPAMRRSGAAVAGAAAPGRIGASIGNGLTTRAAAQLLRTLLSFRLEPDEVEQHRRARPAVGFRNAGHDHRQLEVFERCDARNQIEELKDKADTQEPMLLERALAHRGHVLSVD